MALLIASRGSFGMMARRCRPGCIALARHSLGNKPAGCAVRAVSTVASLPSRQLGCSSAGQLQTGPEMLATSDTHTILPQLLESSHRSWEGGPIAAAIGGIAAGAALAAADSGDSADAVSYHDKVVGEHSATFWHRYVFIFVAYKCLALQGRMRTGSGHIALLKRCSSTSLLLCRPMRTKCT